MKNEELECLVRAVRVWLVAGGVVAGFMLVGEAMKASEEASKRFEEESKRLHESLMKLGKLGELKNPYEQWDASIREAESDLAGVHKQQEKLKFSPMAFFQGILGGETWTKQMNDLLARESRVRALIMSLKEGRKTDEQIEDKAIPAIPREPTTYHVAPGATAAGVFAALHGASSQLGGVPLAGGLERERALSILHGASPQMMMGHAAGRGVRLASEYSLGWTISANEVANDHAYYHEVTVYIGHMRNGVLESISPPFEGRTDYTLEEVLEKRAAYEAAKKAADDARNAVYPFHVGLGC